mgnify:CR=1 FL=1
MFRNCYQPISLSVEFEFELPALLRWMGYDTVDQSTQRCGSFIAYHWICMKGF